MCATTCFRTETRVNPQRSTRRQAVHMRQCSTLLSSWMDRATHNYTAKSFCYKHRTVQTHYHEMSFANQI
jgi:hypothetical protein